MSYEDKQGRERLLQIDKGHINVFIEELSADVATAFRQLVSIDKTKKLDKHLLK